MGVARVIVGLMMGLGVAGCGDEVTGPDGEVRVLGAPEYRAGTMAELTMVNHTGVDVLTRPCADRLDRLTAAGWVEVEGYDSACDAITTRVPAGEARRVVASLPTGLPSGVYRTGHWAHPSDHNCRVYHGEASQPFQVR